jgi:hypothetical protein
MALGFDGDDNPTTYWFFQQKQVGALGSIGHANSFEPGSRTTPVKIIAFSKSKEGNVLQGDYRGFERNPVTKVVLWASGVASARRVFVPIQTPGADATGLALLVF